MLPGACTAGLSLARGQDGKAEEIHVGVKGGLTSEFLPQQRGGSVPVPIPGVGAKPVPPPPVPGVGARPLPCARAVLALPAKSTAAKTTANFRCVMIALACVCSFALERAATTLPVSQENTEAISHVGSAVMAGVVDMNPTHPIEGVLIAPLVVANEAAL